MRQGLVYFPGLVVRGATMTFSPGVQPSIAALTTIPQPNYLHRVGDLVFSFDGITIRFRNCAVKQSTVKVSTTGHLWTIYVMDRRWRWQFGHVSGHYNKRESDGKKIIDSTRALPQDLARICFHAMGETQYDVSQLPNDVLPEIQWDYDSAADSLDSLCAQLGCLVVLGLDDVARIWRIGWGYDLPNIQVMSPQSATEGGVVPASVIAIAQSESLYEEDFTLEAVGLDRDGSYRPLEELAYLPAKGYFDPWLDGVVDDEDLRKAKRTVYRCYRVKGFTRTGDFRSGCLNIAGWEVKDLDQITLTGSKILPNPEKPSEPQKATAKGTFYSTWLEEREVEDTEYDGTVSVRPREKIVVFDRQLFRVDPPDGNPIGPAEMTLRTSYTLRDPLTLQPIRAVYTHYLGAGGAGEVVVVGKGTQFKIIADPDDNSAADSNYTETEEILRSHAENTAAAFMPRLGWNVQYEGLLPISPDGAITQVTWNVGNISTTTTEASRNVRHNNYVPTRLMQISDLEMRVTRANSARFLQNVESVT